MQKNLSFEEKFKKCRKKLRIVTSVLVIFVALAGVYTYLTYDYLAFKHFISSFYIYTDGLDALFKKETGLDVKGRYFMYFDDLVVSVVTKSISEANQDHYTYFYMQEQFQKQRESEQADAQRSEVKPIGDSIIYMKLINFSEQTKKFVNENIALLGKYPMAVIDLRGNYGGDINIMKDISGLFLERGDIIAIDRTRLFDRSLKATTDGVLKYRKIVILQDKNTASAAENMIAALKCNLPGVVLIGGTTFGKGIGQYTIPLKNKFAVKATVMFWDMPNGENIHGKGIAPDISYLEDDIVDFAVRTLLADQGE